MHRPRTELFKCKNFAGRLARWYLTLKEFNPTSKHLPGRVKGAADSLSRNLTVGAVTNHPLVTDLVALRVRDIPCLEI